MGRRYYRSSPPLIAILFIAYIKLFIWAASLCLKIIVNISQWVYDFILNKIEKKRINKIYSETKEEVHHITPKNEVKIYTMNPTNLPYEKKASQITEAEKNFYKVLNDSVAGRFDIQRQVPVTTLVNVTSQNHLIHQNGTLRNFNPDRSRIDRLTIDFVLFNKDDLSPYLAIELDDRSHERENRIKRDELVQEVLAGTGIRLVRVKNAYTYNPETLDMILNL